MKFDEIYTSMDGLTLNADNNNDNGCSSIIDDNENNEIYSSIIDVCLCERRDAIKQIIVNKSISFKGHYIEKGEILEILDASNDAGGGMNVKLLSSGECLYLSCYVEGDFSEYVNNGDYNGKGSAVLEEDVYDYVYARRGQYSPKQNENVLPSRGTPSLAPIMKSDELEKDIKKSNQYFDNKKTCANSYIDMQSHSTQTKKTEELLKDISKKVTDNSYTSFRDRYVEYCSKKQLKLSTFKIDDVVNILTSLSLDHHASKIRDEKINGKTLIHMSEMEICTSLLFTRFEARILSAAISGWTPLLNGNEMNWTEKDHKQFSTNDLYAYLTSVGYSRLADYLIRFKVDGALFQSLVSDDLLSTLELSDGSKLQKLALKDLQIRFNYS